MRTRAVAWLVQPASGKPELFLDRSKAEQRAVDAHAVIHDLFTHPPLASERLAKGLRFADQAMLEVLMSECEKGDEFGHVWQFPRGRRLPADVAEAVDWLTVRGLVVFRDDTGVSLSHSPVDLS